MRLFHVSEDPGITEFHPRPSPQFYESIQEDVVFAISQEMLHNYLLPRDCPRVTYYANAGSAVEDVRKFIGNSNSKYIINVEECQRTAILQTKLYLYEFAHHDFELLDESAGYYISYKSVIPLKVIQIKNIPEELKKYDVELRYHSQLKQLAENISDSSLQYSIIRLRNARS